jgi:nucleoside-diphosphate-sugar epimerase
VKLAVTGATGFVGGRLRALAVAGGHQLRALTRQPRQDERGIEWITGALDHRETLQRLVEECDAVIHVAGVLKARTRAEFDAGNVTGTLNMLAAATAGGVHRFVHVSSLAAREPTLSLYGASKARAEQIVMDSGLDWAIVRPPAVYGPGDAEMLDLFKAARSGFVPLPPAGRLSIIHADDLARLLLALADPDAPHRVLYEPDDGQSGGYSHKEFARAIGAAVERRPLSLSIPTPLLKLSARADQLLRGKGAKLTSDRAAYFCHPDWAVDPAKRPPGELWQPRIDAAAGLAKTAAWYGEQGWL